MTFNDTDYELFCYMFTHGYTKAELITIFKITEAECNLLINKFNLKSPNRQKKLGDLYFCPLCKEYKSKNDFYKSKNSNHGIFTYCIPCHKTYYKKRKLQPKNRIISKAEIAKIKYQTCSSCNITKPIEEFNWGKKYIYVSTRCKECDKKSSKKSYYNLLEKRGY
ncbi:hypothetical protein HMPREF1092_01793 [Clostridium thermobutyricum]|uniref:Uncharacterized protein n=1 Tax=Clostridium thermobutyricum TaxID=29372 RepID=N9XS77_9CLOT|nr:hypothetical protein [Clostridium thermobutyricum]ENZ02558.1 hypothetical protein HMPREF1092_01793 [Clostridium thermobutyricum]